MDATQHIEDSIFEEEDEAGEEHEPGEKRKENEPVAALKVFQNSHVEEMEVPLYLGENILGRDRASCSVLLRAQSISGQHAIISISAFRNDRCSPSNVTEALLWDLGSLNGTRKGRLKLTPLVRYALTEGDSVVFADLPCQYVGLKDMEKVHVGPAVKTNSSSEEGLENSQKKNVLPPVPVWSKENNRSFETPQVTPKHPERTLVSESDSDSDGDQQGRKDNRRFLASDSTSSDLSSPACSTFLTPASKVIPESEDESSITPTSATKRGTCTEGSSEFPKPDPLNFNLDSDTDVEDEQVETKKAEPELDDAKVEAHPGNLHMDSDTDAEDEDVQRPKPETDKTTNKGQDAVTLDSDTDIEENEPLKIETIPTKPVLEDFNINSDTDNVDDVSDSRHPANLQAELQLDGNTDAEKNKTTNVIDEPLIQNKSMENLKSDSDTDLESNTDLEDDTDIRTSKETENSETRAQADNKSPGQVDEFRMDSDTDVEKDEKMEEREQQLGEGATGIPQSSTPRRAGVSEEDMDTQVFLSPSQLFKRPVCPLVLQPCVSPRDINQEDDNFAVAETQSFMSSAALADATLDETPQMLDGCDSLPLGGDSSFEMEPSESSRHPPEAGKYRALTEEDWQLQPTQLYAKSSEESTKVGTMQLDLEATQAYEAEMEEEEEETHPLAAPTHSSVYTTETKLMTKTDEDNSDTNGNGLAVSSERRENEGEALVDSHLSTADTLLIVRSPRQDATQAYTLLTALNKQEEQNQEVHAGLEQVHKEELEKADEVDEEQTQPIESGNTHITIAETQPIGECKEDQEDSSHNEAGSSKGLIAAVEPIEPEDTHAEGEVRQEAEPQNKETRPSKRSCRGRQAGKAQDEKDQEKEPQSEKALPSSKSVKLELTQPLEADDTHVEIAKTQPICEDEEREQQGEPSSSLRSGRGRRTSNAENEEAQKEEPMSEGAKPRRKTVKEKAAVTVEPTQPLASNNTHAEIAETAPLCKDKDGRKEEPQSEGAQPSIGTVSGRPAATVESTQPLESGDAHTKDKEGQDEEQQGKPSSSKRSHKGRPSGKAQDKKEQGQEPLNENAQPSRKSSRGRPIRKVGDAEAQEEELQSEQHRPGKRTGRGRRVSKVEPTQVLEPDNTHAEIPETLILCKEGPEEKPPIEEAQFSKRTSRPKQTLPEDKGDQRTGEIEKRLVEESQSKASSSKECGRRKSIAALEPTQHTESGDSHITAAEDEEGQKEDQQTEASSRSSRRRGAFKIEPTQTTELGSNMPQKLDKAEDEENGKILKGKSKGRGLGTGRVTVQIKGKRKSENLVVEEEENSERVVEMAGRERGPKNLRQKLKKKDNKDDIEMERKKAERAKEDKEPKNLQERKEKEETKKLEREKEEVEEARGLLVKERNVKEELSQREQGKQRQSQEEKDGFEQERKRNKKEEKKMNKEKETGEKEEQEKRQGQGRQMARLDKKDETKKVEEKELPKRHTVNKGSAIPKKEEEAKAESEAKPKRGRCSFRKSQAASASVDDNDDVPAKRTRSRSNSSTSVCSEQSTSTLEIQAGGGRRGGRKYAGETRLSCKGTGSTPSTEKEDTKQNTCSHFSSKGSGIPSSSVANQNPNSTAKGKKSIKVEELELGTGHKPGRGRGRGGKWGVKAETTNEADMVDSVVRQTSSRGCKRGADTTMLTEETPQMGSKTPRRLLAGQTHKVLFTGVIDEDAEKVVVRLGGGLAKGVSDMTHLVTDKVRRTVKFLCAVAKGVPIVTPDWLNKCGKAGSFLSTNGFLVKDVEQERKFNFSLQEALRAANSQPLLQGYEIHVTPSVKPEPLQMKEIINCCGARYLPKMPSAHKAQTVVVSCLEDRAQREKARTLSLPVVSAEFLLTGILQQKVDLQTHSLSSSPAARSRGK